jgi:hypothetical protein
LPACDLSTCSDHFNKLVVAWKKSYPSIESDLEDAFKKIRKDIQACHCTLVPRFSDILGEFSLFKYRHKNSQSREGARGGWRILALYNKRTATMYPIIVYPKKRLSDVPADDVVVAVKEVISIITPSLFPPKT